MQITLANHERKSALQILNIPRETTTPFAARLLLFFQLGWWALAMTDIRYW
jgi:hypothetical protein